jgi:hypothetical protein
MEHNEVGSGGVECIHFVHDTDKCSGFCEQGNGPAVFIKCGGFLTSEEGLCPKQLV